MREFRVEVDMKERSRRDSAVQTDSVDMQANKVYDLLNEFPNLKKGGGLLPYPSSPRGERKVVNPLEWTVVFYPRNQGGGRKVIRSSPVCSPVTTPGGGLSETPMLWNCVHGEEYPDAVDD